MIVESPIEVGQKKEMVTLIHLYASVNDIDFEDVSHDKYSFQKFCYYLFKSEVEFKNKSIYFSANNTILHYQNQSCNVINQLFTQIGFERVKGRPGLLQDVMLNSCIAIEFLRGKELKIPRLSESEDRIDYVDNNNPKRFIKIDSKRKEKFRYIQSTKKMELYLPKIKLHKSQYGITIL